MSSYNNFLMNPVENYVALVRSHASYAAMLIAVLIIILLVLLFKSMMAPAVVSHLSNYTGSGAAVALTTSDMRGYNEPTYNCSARAKAVAAAASPQAQIDNSSIETVPIVPSAPVVSKMKNRSGFTVAASNDKLISILGGN